MTFVIVCESVLFSMEKLFLFTSLILPDLELLFLKLVFWYGADCFSCPRVACPNLIFLRPDSFFLSCCSSLF
jgi:hypothetical protein